MVEMYLNVLGPVGANDRVLNGIAYGSIIMMDDTRIPVYAHIHRVDDLGTGKYISFNVYTMDGKTIFKTKDTINNGLTKYALAEQWDYTPFSIIKKG